MRARYDRFMEAKRNTKSIGDASEATMIGILVRAGCLVSIPFGENHRYDLVAEIGGALKRIQVKTGRLRKGVVLFNCCSTHGHRGHPNRPYTGNEIDYYGVFCPELGSAYLVPIAAVRATTVGSLRVEPTTNGQAKHLLWGSPYEIMAPGFGPVGLAAGLGVLPQAPELPL